MEGRFGVSSRYEVFLEWKCMYTVRFAYFLYGPDVKMLQVRGLNRQFLNVLFSADRFGGVIAHLNKTRLKVYGHYIMKILPFVIIFQLFRHKAL